MTAPLDQTPAAGLTTRHGERRCYLQGCRRDECSQANYRYLARYRLDRARGTRRRVPATPVAQHVRQLAAEGWSHKQIGAAANCLPRIITSLSAGDYQTIRSDLAARILAARPHIDLVPPRSYVNAAGTIRRVQALIAIGHPLKAIAAECGMTKTALGRVVNYGHERITARHATAVSALYRRWSDQPGTNTRARNRAAAAGWKDPLWWEDMGHIDDPGFDPATAERDLNRDQLAAHRRAEIAHLHSFGLTEETIAARLGLALSTVHAITAELRTGQRRDRTKAVA